MKTLNTVQKTITSTADYIIQDTLLKQMIGTSGFTTQMHTCGFRYKRQQVQCMNIYLEL